MNKILLVIIILFGTLLHAQDKPDWDYDIRQPISAIFPTKLPSTIEYIPIQTTYFDWNWTANNLRLLIEENLGLVYQDNSPEWTDVYKTPAGAVVDVLKIKYNTFELYGLPVIKSIQIDGSANQVAKVFIWLYNNSMNAGSDITQYTKTYAQDRATLSVDGGKATLTIENAVYGNDIAKFATDFNTKKDEYLKGGQSNYYEPVED